MLQAKMTGKEMRMMEILNKTRRNKMLQLQVKSPAHLLVLVVRQV